MIISCFETTKMGKHWVDGTYCLKRTPWFCNEVQGEVAYWRNLAEYDHPEFRNTNMEGMQQYICK